MEDIVGKYMYLQLVNDHLLVVMSHSALVENHLHLPVVLEILSRNIPKKEIKNASFLKSIAICLREKFFYYYRHLIVTSYQVLSF